MTTDDEINVEQMMKERKLRGVLPVLQNMKKLFDCSTKATKRMQRMEQFITLTHRATLVTSGIPVAQLRCVRCIAYTFTPFMYLYDLCILRDLQIHSCANDDNGSVRNYCEHCEGVLWIDFNHCNDTKVNCVFASILYLQIFHLFSVF